MTTSDGAPLLARLPLQAQTRFWRAKFRTTPSAALTSRCHTTSSSPRQTRCKRRCRLCTTDSGGTLVAEINYGGFLNLTVINGTCLLSSNRIREHQTNSNCGSCELVAEDLEGPGFFASPTRTPLNPNLAFPDHTNGLNRFGPRKLDSALSMRVSINSDWAPVA